MQILIFSENYSPDVGGGSELAIKEAANHLSQHDFTIITSRMNPDRPAFERNENVDIYRVGMGNQFDTYLYAAFGWIKALTLHAQSKFDLIWTVMASQGGLSAALFEIFSKKPLLLTLHEGNDWQHVRWYKDSEGFFSRTFIKPLHDLVFKRAAYITATSAYLQKKAESVSPETPMSLIPNGVNTKTFLENIDKDTVAKIRSIYAGENQHLIISTSQLIRKNAISDLIQALVFLPDTYHLLILGNGPERRSLERQIKRLGLQGRVSMPGVVDHSQVPQYMAAADIFARPSLAEGMGNSFIEAMAARLPVVATPVGGVLNFLENEETGLFAEVSNSKSVASAIKRLIEDEELQSKVVENAYKLVTDEYGWDTISGYYSQVFDYMAAQDTA